MRYLLVFVFAYASVSLQAQETLESLLKKHNTKSIPYMTVQELAMPKTNAIILDTRELDEYKVSHLKNAIHVGYSHFKIDSVLYNIQNKATPIVTYCSLGIRSETIAIHLKKAGYTHIKNLYGGIFEWKNNNLSVYNIQEKETDSIHTFSKVWSKWLKKGIKVYD
ncbi:rhodanese-like domain-containing protein [Mariniflexile ostreae]|uniref:Rhodanese-like domain-containing protein n=1 Tax=Mariniflexile ostreae TaxID=1520892 RepID=A0ABV5FDI7_9FLAO